MSLTELFIIAVGLSMDAFAVAVCKGLAMPRMSWKGAGVVGLYFGGFQGAMPFIGYLLGTRFRDAITAYDHWIAFILLALIDHQQRDGGADSKGPGGKPGAKLVNAQGHRVG